MEGNDKKLDAKSLLKGAVLHENMMKNIDDQPSPITYRLPNAGEYKINDMAPIRDLFRQSPISCITSVKIVNGIPEITTTRTS